MNFRCVEQFSMAEGFSRSGSMLETTTRLLPVLLRSSLLQMSLDSNVHHTSNVSGGHGAMVLYVNSFVHVVMYSYYFVTSLWPEYGKKLWWKKYITQLQMVISIAFT
jgi:hypothetical protein